MNDVDKTTQHTLHRLGIGFIHLYYSQIKHDIITSSN